MTREDIQQLRTITLEVIQQCQDAHEKSDEIIESGAPRSGAEHKAFRRNSAAFCNNEVFLSALKGFSYDAELFIRYPLTALIDMNVEAIERITVIKILYTDIVDLLHFPHEGHREELALKAGMEIQASMLLQKANQLKKLFSQCEELWK